MTDISDVDNSLKLAIETLTQKYNSLTKTNFHKKFDTDHTTDFSYAVAKLRVNSGRNRYTDVLAREETRVKTPNIRYINANYSLNNNYIMAQGPINPYIYDFWTMIWDCDIDTIFCLSNQFENNKLKYDQYFNDDNNFFQRNYLIKVISIENLSQFIVHRKITIQHLDINCEKTINHYKYTNWPDHGIPTSSINVYKLIEIATNCQIENKKFLIHCSAGIGRTGTLAVLYEILSPIIMLHDLNKIVDYANSINIDDVITNLRTRRSGVVQNYDQYKYCYLAVIEYLKLMMS